MILGRVLGNVVATQKNSRYGEARIMLVQPVNPNGTPRGASILALDSVDSGEGDLVPAWRYRVTRGVRPQRALPVLRTRRGGYGECSS